MAKIKYNGNITELAEGKTAVINCTDAEMQDVVIITGACKVEYQGAVKEIAENQSAVIHCRNAKMEDIVMVKVEQSGSGDSGGDTEQTNGTEGLVYTLNSDGVSYSCTGIGTFTGTDVVIASECNGLPVTMVGDRAFFRCETLVSVTLPDSITRIEERAFSDCTSLIGITIPYSVTQTGIAVFDGCTSLERVVFADGIQLSSIRDELFSGCISLTEIIIPNSVKGIYRSAFNTCASLTSITIPSSVTHIRAGAFSYSNALTIYVETSSKPSGWESGWNGWNAAGEKYIPVVWNCASNETASDGYKYEIIDGIRYALKGSVAIVEGQPANITVVNIPSTVTYSGNSYSVTTIAQYAFYGSKSLVMVTIPSSVISIDRAAFCNCTELIIRTEHTSKPSGWDDDWNFSDRPVVWDCNNNDVAIFTFLIGGTTYTSEYPMTWGEWMASKYNTDGYIAPDGYITSADGKNVYDGNGNQIKTSDGIIVGKWYLFYPYSGN
jgi:hypothetical protein